MKYGGESREQWLCGTWFEHIGGGSTDRESVHNHQIE
jgi:hypothetical protein